MLHGREVYLLIPNESARRARGAHPPQGVDPLFHAPHRARRPSPPDHVIWKRLLEELLEG